VPDLDPHARGVFEVRAHDPGGAPGALVERPEQRVVRRADDAQEDALAVAVVKPAEALPVVAEAEHFAHERRQVFGTFEFEQHRRLVGELWRGAFARDRQQLRPARHVLRFVARVALRPLHADPVEVLGDRLGERLGGLDVDLALVVETDGRWGERHVGGDDPAGDRESERVEIGEQQDHGCCGV